MKSEQLSVGIVGSGIAGLATAIRLAIKGHHVSVFEANSYPGGKLSEVRKGSYRFDAGPSLFTLPELVEELFELAGEEANHCFKYEKLEVNCHYFFEDDTFLKAYADQSDLEREIYEKTGEPKANVRKAIERSAFLYDRLSELFMFSALDDPSIFISSPAFKAYAALPKLGFFQSMNGSNERVFESPKMVQLFNRYATYNGSDPYKTPATMNIIPHLEMSIGAFYPKGGMHAITQELYSLALRLGVLFHFDSPVSKIIVADNEVRGLEVNGGIQSFDRVVSNMDMVNTYKYLLPEKFAPKKLLNQPKSSSALIFYWGVRSEFSNLDLHNIFFSENYKEEFECIFDKGEIYHDPTVYVNVTSKMEKSDAPVGCENWFTMINVPNNQGQNWDDLIAQARVFVLNKLSRMLGRDIAALIEVEEILDPRSIESKTSSAQGALYGNSSNNLFAAFLRHPNRSKSIKNLYFCGGSVHPGGGIPMCLSSAKIVDRYFR